MNGQTGILVPPDDAGALTSALERSASRIRALREAARATRSKERACTPRFPQEQMLDEDLRAVRGD